MTRNIDPPSISLFNQWRDSGLKAELDRGVGPSGPAPFFFSPAVDDTEPDASVESGTEES